MPPCPARARAVDAAHEYADIKEDIERWLPLLSRCGVMLGDDYIGYWPGVMFAVNELALRGDYEVHRPPVELGLGSPSGRDLDLGVKWWARRKGCPPQRARPSEGRKHQKHHKNGVA